MIRIAIVTVNFRNAAETVACLDSLAEAGAGELGLFVIENGSGDGSEETLRAYIRGSRLRVELIAMDRNLGFAAGSNVGIREAMAKGYSHIVLLNNDTRVDPDFAMALKEAVSRAPEAVIAGYISDLDTGRPTYNFGSIGKWTGLIGFHSPDRRGPVEPFDFISGCLMVAPSAVFRRVGLLKEEFFLYCEDLEFSMRLKAAGVPLAYDSGIAIRHRVSSTVTKTAFPKDYYRMRNQTYAVLRYGTAPQKAIYLGRVALTMAWKIGDWRLFRQFAAGIRDGIAGRLGHNPGMRP